jgi:flagellar hook protein FlgE
MEIMNVALTGMEGAQSSFQRTAGRIAASGEFQPDSVDLSGEMTALLEARNQFQSNARVIQTGDEMTKTVLDLLA